MRPNVSAGRPAFTLNDWTGRIESDLARVSADDLPDFFVLSPPRTGTTWVANVLAAHDEIYIPPEKELRYFDVGWQCSAIDFYLSRFRPGRGRVKGDASPSYVLLPIEVIRLLRQAKPTLKFIIVVRDLAERAWSNFNHSFAVGELGLAGKRWAQDKVAVEHTLDYLVSDYSVMVGDYAAYLTRWLQCFPPEQFFVFRLDQDDAEKEALLRHLHQFLGVGTSVRGADALYRKINAGYRTGSVARDVHQLLRALYTARQPQQDRFLHETFGVSLPEPAASEGDAQTLVELLNRADGYKVFVWRGCFYASFLEDFPRVEQALVNGRTPPDTCLAAHTYSDLIASIEAQKCGIEGPPVQRESQRLLHVLQRLAEDYARTNQLHVNLGTLRLLHEHAGFNLLAFGGQVIALRQLLGPVDLTGSDAEQLVARYGSDNVVVGRSVDEVVERIDSPATSNDAPERVAENIAAPVRDAADDRSHLIDGPFLDCNLVGYRARVYAIPRALGRVRLDTLPPGKLALLPSASSVSELQALLSVGGAVLARRLDAMRASGRTVPLASGRDTACLPGTHAYARQIPGHRRDRAEPVHDLAHASPQARSGRRVV